MWPLIPLALVAAYALSSKKVSAAGSLPEPTHVVKENDGVQIPAGWREIYSGKVPYDLQMLAAAQFPEVATRTNVPPLGTLRPFTYQGQSYGALLRRYYTATLVPSLT